MPWTAVRHSPDWKEKPEENCIQDRAYIPPCSSLPPQNTSFLYHSLFFFFFSLNKCDKNRATPKEKNWPTQQMLYGMLLPNPCACINPMWIKLRKVKYKLISHSAAQVLNHEVRQDLVLSLKSKDYREQFTLKGYLAAQVGAFTITK